MLFLSLVLAQDVTESTSGSGEGECVPYFDESVPNIDWYDYYSGIHGYETGDIGTVTHDEHPSDATYTESTNEAPPTGIIIVPEPTNPPTRAPATSTSGMSSSSTFSSTYSSSSSSTIVERKRQEPGDETGYYYFFDTDYYGQVSHEDHCNTNCPHSWIGDGVCDIACFAANCCFDCGAKGCDCEGIIGYAEGEGIYFPLINFAEGEGEGEGEGYLPCTDKDGTGLGVHLTVELSVGIDNFGESTFIVDLSDALDVPADAFASVTIDLDASTSEATVVSFEIVSVNACFSALNKAKQLHAMLTSEEEAAASSGVLAGARLLRAERSTGDGEGNQVGASSPTFMAPAALALAAAAVGLVN